MLATSLLLAACHGPSPTPSAPRPVKLYRIAAPTEIKPERYAGEVTPRRETTLSFRVAGKLVERLVEVGNPVRKGQLLARLDPSDYRLSTQSLKAQWNSARADQEFLRGELQRYEVLFEQKVISAPELDRHRTALTNAHERVAALEAQQGQSTNQLKYTDLVADRDGAITALLVEVGDVVAAGQPMGKLAQLEEKEVSIQVPEHRVAELRPGQDVVVSLWSDDALRIPGKLREIAAAADPATRTYRVKVTLLEAEARARLGMTASVWIARDRQTRVSIPLSAVFTPQAQPQTPRVWLLDAATGKVRSQTVELGEMLDGESVAVSDLSSGQIIVSAGVQRLREGDSVQESVLAAGPRP